MQHSERLPRGNKQLSSKYNYAKLGIINSYMERNRRRSRGSMVSKLIPFCKAGKPPTDHSQDLYNNVYYTSYAPQPDFNNYVTPHPPPKVSFFLQSSVAPKGRDMENKLNMRAEKLRGRVINGVDESVDVRAASYISSVRERFKLDHCERGTKVISLDEDVD